MEASILDKDFNAVYLLDQFSSFIWTDRYNSYGDFEVYTKFDSYFLKYCIKDYYLWNKESDHVMIIDSVSIDTDIEIGPTITVTGFSLEKILDRRIVWTQTNLTGNFQNGIEKLLNDNIINPSISDRKISNFIFKKSEDPVITSLTIDVQFTGDYLYDVISNQCMEKNIGFKITLNDKNQFVFELYSGVDRSYNQDKNPFIVFSPNFDNMINSNYYESNTEYKNVALVAGEGEGSNRKSYVVGSSSGMDRRELYVDARDISTQTNEGNLTEAQYKTKLEERGKEKLAEYPQESLFSGTAETIRSFKYGKDFFMGDIVQTTNEYNLESASRIEEMIFTHDENGYTAVPTFAAI